MMVDLNEVFDLLGDLKIKYDKEMKVEQLTHGEQCSIIGKKIAVSDLEIELLKIVESCQH